MRVYEKNRIKKILYGVSKNIEILKQSDGRIITENIVDIFSMCQQSIDVVGEFIQVNFTDCNVLLDVLEDICKKIFFAAKKTYIDSVLLNDIINDVKSVSDEIEKYDTDKAIVLFLPYKASMWDCFHSIYEESIRDERCETYVMPIPYYEKEGLNREFKYECELFDNTLNLLNYSEVDLEQMMPDIIYFHNPYDEKNLVTEVDSKFFSKNLKNYTDMLVYVPYYISGIFKSEAKMIEKLLLPGVFNADVVICQAMIQKEIYSKNKIDSEKYIVCGNPKFDELINYSKHHSLEQKKNKFGISGDKKVVLVNTSISYFLNKETWFELYSELFENVSSLDVNVIWRPHPLLEATIKNMRPELYKKYKKFYEFIDSIDNVIIDNSSSPLDAMFIADALISDYSSLLFQFYVTGKPLFSVDGTSKYRECGIVVFDYYDAYLRSENLKMHEFVELIIAGNDWKKEKRLKKISEYSFLSDGRCGKRIHDSILEKIDVK